MNGKNSIQALEKEIADLEYRLRNARTRLTLARPVGGQNLTEEVTHGLVEGMVHLCLKSAFMYDNHGGCRDGVTDHWRVIPCAPLGGLM